jgi:excisionase family DNA binding protein
MTFKTQNATVDVVAIFKRFPHLAFSEGKLMLKVREAAKKLRVADQHILDLIEEGKLQAINVGGHTRKFWRIPIEAWALYIQNHHH